MAEQPINPLMTELTHWHDVARLRYRQFLEAVTALELTDAERHLALFARLLSATMEFSADRLQLLDNDQNNAQQIIKADQMILRRTLDLVTTAVAELIEHSRNKENRLRSALVDRLDVMVRMQNILINHQQRQQETIIAQFPAHADPAMSQKLADQLNAVMHQVQPN